MYQEGVGSTGGLSRPRTVLAYSYVSAIPGGIYVVIVDAAARAILKVHVTVQKQYVLALFLMTNGVPSLDSLCVADG
jgi:hypothetical protein